MDAGAGLTSGVAGVAVGLPAAVACFAYPARGPFLIGTIRPRQQSPALPCAVVAVAGAASGLVGARLGWRPVLPAFVLAAVVGLTLAVIDLRVRQLPFALSGLVYGACAVNFGVEAIAEHDLVPPGRATAAGLVVSAAFLGLALALPGQLGLGDVVLVGWIASTLAWLNWFNLVLGLVTGVSLQFLAAIALLLFRRTSRGAAPMGPAMWVGWLIGVVTVA
jgi:leader peptidase (prepilin peptidase)/N-methyltransferase